MRMPRTPRTHPVVSLGFASLTVVFAASSLGCDDDGGENGKPSGELDAGDSGPSGDGDLGGDGAVEPGDGDAGDGDAGDGDGDGDSPYHSNGSRLKAVLLETDGAAPVFAGWVDTELNVPCEFLPASDGKTRCLPIAPRNLVGSLNFVDAACSKVAASISLDCEPGAYRLLPSSACEGGFAVHAVDELPEGSVSYVLDGEDCIKTETPVRLALGAEQPATRFVAAVAEDVALGGLTRRALVAEDGARQLLGAVLPAFPSSQCAFREIEGRWRCVPEAAAERADALVFGQEFFAAPECSGDALFYGPAHGERCDVVVGLDFAAGRCAPEVYDVADRFTAPAHANIGGMCREAQVPGDLALFAGGEALPITDFSEATLASQGSGRLRAREYHAASELVQLSDGALSAYGVSFEDDELDAPCEPFQVSGAVRCVPRPFVYVSVFSDAACTQRVAESFEDGRLCGRTPPLVSLVSLDYCSKGRGGKYAELSDVEVFAVAAELAQDAPLFFRDGNECKPRTRSEGGRYFALGDRVPTTDLASLKVVLP